MGEMIGEAVAALGGGELASDAAVGEVAQAGAGEMIGGESADFVVIETDAMLDGDFAEGGVDEGDVESAGGVNERAVGNVGEDAAGSEAGDFAGGGDAAVAHEHDAPALLAGVLHDAVEALAAGAVASVDADGDGGLER